jgi:hypothetical protein
VKERSGKEQRKEGREEEWNEGDEPHGRFKPRGSGRASREQSRYNAKPKKVTLATVLSEKGGFARSTCRPVQSKCVTAACPVSAFQIIASTTERIFPAGSLGAEESMSATDVLFLKSGHPGGLISPSDACFRCFASPACAPFFLF